MSNQCKMFHRWGKWWVTLQAEGKQTLFGRSSDVEVIRQQRECERCGKTEAQTTINR